MTTWLVAPFPQTPQVSNYGEKFRNTAHHDGVDEGPVMSRRIGLAGPKPFTCVFWLTAAEVTQLRTWWEDTIEDGTIEFDFPHPHPGVGGTIVCQMFKPPDAKTQGGDLWTVGCEITEVLA